MTFVPMLKLQVMSERLAVCRLEPDATVPEWATQGPYFSVTKTSDELSLVCNDAAVPSDVKAQRGWRALKVEGPLDFTLTGVLARLLKPLAEAKISVFTLSTFDTDYVLVKEDALTPAIAALRGAGHRVTLP